MPPPPPLTPPPQVLLDTLELSAVIKKTPVVVGNCTGFAVNRVFFPYTMAACLLMDCGVNPFQVRTERWRRLAGGVLGGRRVHVCQVAQLHAVLCGTER